MSSEFQERTVTCPACQSPSLYSPRNPFRPFCCARCKGVDFGAWATESYRVEAKSSDLEHELDLDPDALH
jgi:endogenous inhibitor of DNA gyrase (YacG/DUF329 family)